MRNTGSDVMMIGRDESHSNNVNQIGRDESRPYEYET